MKLSRRNFLKLVGLTAIGINVPKSYLSKNLSFETKVIEELPKKDDIYNSYSCVDEALMKVHPFPDKCRKMRDEFHVKGMKLAAKNAGREIVKTEIKDMGLLRQIDPQNKTYYAYVSECTLFLKPKAA